MTPSLDLVDNGWRRDFVLTWLGRFGIFLAHHVTRPLIPLYLITFGASSTIIGAFMSVFTVTALSSRVPVGLFIDRLGRKPFLLYGIATFCLGKLGYLWAPSIALLVPFRVLHGLGWSGCTTAVSTIPADIVPQARRGDMMSYAGLASSVAAALGPVLGFAIYQRYHFQGVFIAAVGLLVSSFVLSLPVAEPQRPPAKTDASTRWWQNLFVKDSLDPAIGILFLSFGHGGILTFLPIHALRIGFSNPGIWFGVYAACILASRPIAGPISDKVNRRAVIIPGLILNLIGIVLLAFSTSSTLLLAGAVVTGFGTGAAQPALMTLAVDRSRPEQRGRSLAQFQFSYDLGIGVGSLSLGALLDLVNQSFLIMYLATAAVALLGLWISWSRK